MNPADTTTAGGSSVGSSVTDDLSDDARRLGDTAANRARQEAEGAKEQTTRTAHSAASAIDRAAEELERDENTPSWLSSAFRQTASGIEQLAGSVEGRSPDQLAQDLTRFARENPTTFLAASAAAGFAAARFFRAGYDYKQDHRFDQQGTQAASGSFGGGSSNTGGFSSGGQSATGTGATRETSWSTGSYGSGSGLSSGSGGSSGQTQPVASEPAGYGSNPIKGGPA